MLADKYALVVLDKSGSSLLLLCLIVPGTGVADLHSCGRADRACAEEERSHTGDNLSIGESADIADNSLFIGDLSFFDHLVELHTCCNTCNITTLVDGSECVVEVVKSGNLCGSTGSMAELNVRIFGSSLLHE